MSGATGSDRHDAAWLDWLVAQRWYGDKSRVIASHMRQPIARVDLDREAALISADTVVFADGERTTYLVTLLDTPQIEDATGRADFLAWLAHGFRGGASAPAGELAGATLHWEPLPGADESWVTRPARLLSGEQSNTSVIFGDTAIVKIFRKVQPGINPDSEIVAFLTARTGYRHVPAYLGSLVLRFADGSESQELAAVQAFVPNQGDCWRWLPGALRSGSDASRLALLDEIALLGQRTGELHVALTSSSDLSAFAPEYYSPDDADAVAARVRGEVAATCAALCAHGALSNADAQRLETRLTQRIGDGSVLAGLPRIRVHGDYHLGQVLRSDNDFVIIDFEGEPSRSMAERRQKHSPFKDVAGMVRSLDYAVSSATFDTSPADAAQLLEWGRNAEERFIDGYRGAASAARIPIVPDTAGQFALAHDLYLVDKAVYEVRYELDNRPDWLRIPLGGLQRIAAV